MQKDLRREQALEYHAKGRPGKIEVVPTKEAKTQRDLSLAYSPGVAEPCLEIAANVDNVYKYTAKGNLVAVISNGTAVLGLGDIGPEAGKPVMEGKGVLFKKFADIDVFDIELRAPKAEDVIRVRRLAMAALASSKQADEETITAAAAKMTRPECARPPTIASRGSWLRSWCSFAAESRNTV